MPKVIFRIMVIYAALNDYAWCGSNIWHSMLAFSTANIVSIKKKPQENNSNNYVIIYGNLQQFCDFCLDGNYRQHHIS